MRISALTTARKEQADLLGKSLGLDTSDASCFYGLLHRHDNLGLTGFPGNYGEDFKPMEGCGTGGGTVGNGNGAVNGTNGPGAVAANGISNGLNGKFNGTL